MTALPLSTIDHRLSTSLTALRLSNFRNHAALTLDPGGQSVILTGENGAGKTNILEAVSLLAPGRGLRNAKLIDLPLKPIDYQPSPIDWQIIADLQTPHATHRIGTGSDPESPNISRRLIRVDEKPASQTDLAEYCAIAWLTPAMDRLFLESPSGRRKFLDRLVYAFRPDHLRHLNALEKAQRERARILSFGRIDQDWIATLESQMAEASIQLSSARAEYLSRLDRHIGAFAPDFPALQVSLKSTVPGDAAEMKDRFLASRERDRFAGTTREGAGRDDLTALHLGKSRAVEGCSTGEQKMAVLSILLAHAKLLGEELGKRPILLLDELAAHLDPHHRAALCRIILDLNVQAWMTGADASLFSDWKNKARFVAVGMAI